MKKLPLLASALVAGLFSFGAAAPAVATSAPDTPQQHVVEEVNNLRLEVSSEVLEPLTISPELTEQAQEWAERQAKKGEVKEDPDFRGKLPKGWSEAAQNVGQSESPEELVNSWASSEVEGANLLGDYTVTGVGYADGYYTQLFAYYPEVEPSPSPSVKPVIPVKPAPKPTVKPSPKPTAESEVVKPQATPKATVKPQRQATPKQTERLNPTQEGLVDPSGEVSPDAGANGDGSTIGGELENDTSVIDSGSVASSKPAPLLWVLAGVTSLLIAILSFVLYRILRKS